MPLQSYEMKDSGVEWIGEIPKHWNVKRLKSTMVSLSKGNGITKDETFENGDTPCVRYGEIYTQYNQFFTECKTRTNIDIIPSPKYFTRGDILFTCTGEKVDEIGKSVAYLGNEKCLAGGDIIILKHTQCASFLNYALNSNYAQSQKSCDKAKLKVVHISASDIGNILLALPPLSEQQSIASYLDEKCAVIDEIIAEAKTTIDEYKSWKASVIFEAITKGLDKNADMKDSGVEWIGMIPSQCEIITLGNATSSLRNGFVGPTRDILKESGIRYIQSLHIKEGKIYFDKHPYFVDEAWGFDHPKIMTDDILIVQTGDIGQVALVEEEFNGCNCHAIIIASPLKDIINSKYLTYYLLSHIGKELLLSTQTGALLPHLNVGKIKAVPIILPPLAEQQSIAAYLEEKCAAIDGIIAEKEALISELENYKKSLIFETVTGKRRVC